MAHGVQGRVPMFWGSHYFPFWKVLFQTGNTAVHMISPQVPPVIDKFLFLLFPYSGTLWGSFKTGTREWYARISQKSTLVWKIVLYTYDNNYWIFILSYSIWASSNDSFLLIICYLKGKNKLCCIIISHCDLKPKWINIVFVLKMRKGLLNSQIHTSR